MSEDPNGASPRLAIVDGLRGYALMGLFLVHMLEYFELYWAHPAPTPVTTAVFTLFMGKTFSLLALCFGFSFFVMMDGAARRGQPFAGRFAWRLTLLAAIGMLHGLVYRGDIIVVLALAGFVLIPFDKVRSNRVLLAVAGLCFLQPYILLWIAAGAAGAPWALKPPHHFSDPAMATYLTGDLGQVLRANLWEGQVNKWWFFIETGRCVQVLGLFLVGLVLGRIGFFADPGRFRRGRAIALAAVALVAAACYGLKARTGGHGSGPVFWTNMLAGGWFDLSCMAASVLVFVQLWRAGGERVLRVLVPTGRMTLSLYVGQSLVFVPLFYPLGLGLYERMTPPLALAIGLAAIAVQLVLAAAWFKAFHYGPLEWLWRCGTRQSFGVPFRRRPEPQLA
ncbi:DUF418 domain-containing protein [Caulobacter sp. UNC279MFTsu5.1]|uniref:DUF418 domain-containing protein n=1 Tax=Caulobacter sp. UNC279MFTsu5.1 TaxID=1502775 RepID=UPI0008E7523E|nr:DUF418 domain-containing protein [Caulobacter sp. UNC279MFTsu5.1]SFK23369.1 uncharacterized protein SAMN02799626_03753 [Caulobacter sp. UNC279MFTsu5.1]